MKFVQKIVSYIFPFVIGAIFVCFIYGTVCSTSSYEEKSIEVIEDNIRKAAITCYSIEGYYPADISYLEENYGLVIDNQKVNVFCQSLGSNLFPDIMVTYKRGAA